MSIFFRETPIVWFVGALWVVLVVGCSDRESSIEDSLCEIFQEVNDKDIKDVSEREGVLATSIQERLPSFFNNHYVNLVQVDWGQRADTVERVLEAIDESRKPELCSPIISYYER